MKKSHIIKILLGATAITLPTTAYAEIGGPVPVAEGLTLDPIVDFRIGYEHVNQPVTNADALTARMRAGFELASDFGLSFLVEAEANLGIINDYNDANITNGIEPFSVVADPENVELNRIQLKYAKKGVGSVTLGRQRINIDNQRFVGSVGWRQNEQTFDAVRAVVKPIKPVTLEATYAISQRTIFGVDGGAREHFDGDHVFLGAGLDAGLFKVKGFSYLLDYDPGQPVSNNSTQTYGVLASTKLPISGKFSIDFEGSYAVQKDYKSNPNNFSVEYVAGSAAAKYAGFGIKAGFENLGADGFGNRFQTPLATLHKFNGWADVFLSTPLFGLRDKYIGATKKVDVLGGVKLGATYHDFNSDIGNFDYGTEIDAVIGFKVKKVGVTLKYANYNAQGLGVDTEKFWLRLGYKF